jgi:hypothetical protein
VPSDAKNVLHAHHLATDGEDVPEAVANAVRGLLDIAATHSSRVEWLQSLAAAYAAIGTYEDYLTEETA